MMQYLYFSTLSPGQAGSKWSEALRGRENLLYLCLNKKLPYGVPNVVFI